jgi:hypothetical protein
MQTNEDQPLPGETTPPPPSPEEGGQVQPSGSVPDNPNEAERALARQWMGRIKKAKAKWAPVFKRMRDDMAFSQGKQWPQQQEEDTRYVCNITLRQVNQKVAGLYAKNPTTIATRRKSLDFKLWDGNPESIQQAQQAMSAVDPMTGQPLPLPPQAMQMAQAFMADVQQGMERRMQADKIGKTLEIVYEWQVQEQQIPFKTSMKQLVRRVVVTGVGYCKLGYHRLMQKLPGDVERVTDVTQPARRAERINLELQDGKRDKDDAQAAELFSMATAIQDQQQILVKEGLDFEFPGATTLIVDPACRQLVGFVGARWVAQEYMLTPEDVKEIYGIDVGQNFTGYTSGGQNAATQQLIYGTESKRAEGSQCAVYELYDKATGMTMTLCEGYPDFLISPVVPPLMIETFWPWFVLVFNATEDEECIFPPSDVFLMRNMQVEHNVARQRLKEHRDAARPKHAVARGLLDEPDKQALTGSSAHTLVELNGLPPGTPIDSVLQRVPYSPIDPALYEVNSSMEDVLKAVGSQEANLGGTSSSTATESSIAESSRMTAQGSNADDLDDFLTAIAQAASHILLTELSPETATEIAGPGALWPELSREQIAKDLTLTVRAGSSGRPNKAAEIQNMQQIAPFLMQVPGIKPEWIAQQLVQRLDDRVDLTDAFAQSMPSIMQMNQPPQGAGAAVPGGGPTPPEQQGPQGANNNQKPPQAGPSTGPGATSQGGQPPTTPGNVVQMGQGQ